MAIRTGIRFWREQRVGEDSKPTSQAELGRLTGIRQDRLSRLENGETVATTDELRTLTEILGVTETHLYSEAMLREIHGAEQVA